MGRAIKQGEWLFDFSRAAMQAKDQNEIWDLLKSTLSLFGVRWVNYAFGEPRNAVLFSSMGPGWLEHYSENFARTDMLIRHCLTAQHTLYLDPSFFNGGTETDHANKAMLSQMSDLGIRGALAIPLQGASSNFISCSAVFFTLDERESLEAMTRHGEEIALIMNLAHQFMGTQELQTGENVYSTAFGKKIAARSILTNREKEVLRFLSIGMRPDRIAEKMGLQSSTVNMHISKARRRIGAATREQAIVRAINDRQLIL